MVQLSQGQHGSLATAVIQSAIIGHGAPYAFIGLVDV